MGSSLRTRWLILGCMFRGSVMCPSRLSLESHVSDPTRPTVGLCFYRSHRLTGNTAFVDALCAAIEEAGANALAVWSYTLRRDGGGNVPALAMLDGHVDALIVTMLATGGSGAADAAAGDGEGVGEQWQEWDATALAALDVPVIQAVCATASRAAWLESDSGLAPLDAATQVAIPEFDGRILGGVISFKERDSDGSPVGAPVPRYVPDPERCARVARLAVRSARLRHLPPERRRVAMLLTSFPTKHAKVGMAVGLDTPASALKLLDALHADGMLVERPFADGDELMHTLIASGGHDPEFLTDDQLADSSLRLPVADYIDWYRTLPDTLRAGIEERWGPPPGDRYLDGEDFVIAGLELGNVLVAIQPPRGYGEDPVGIYHDPELPPTHHYLACYRWLDAVWGADAIVHLGKHGTLEWLPGKMLALSAACAPDAALGDIPLVYPFVVNDPGEGVQAKRRAHAVIVDHLVPPMMRADSYDELAELEALLDEYARLELLDPPKLPALAARIWSAIERANLQADLGLTDEEPDPAHPGLSASGRPRHSLSERPDNLGELVQHIDGYLCEVKDIQIKDGLHVFGQAPEGQQLRGLTAAMLRLGSGDVPGLRRAVAAAFGLDEPALVAAPGVPVAAPGASPNAGLSAGADAPAVPAELIERFRGPSASAGDLVDRLEAAQLALLDALAVRDWDADAVERVCVARWDTETTASSARCGSPRGRSSPASAARATRSSTCSPRSTAATSPPARPAVPTRGRLDVLPTGRNFYSVDPRAAAVRAVVGVGQRLADALLERHRRETGRAAADGRPRRLGHVGDAHAGRRRRRDPRAARRPSDLASAVATRHRHRGDLPGRARAPADRRDRPHLRLLPRRVPSSDRAARRRRRGGRRARRARRRQLRGCARARRRRAPRRRAGRRWRLATRDHARVRLQARHLRRGAAAAARRSRLYERRRGGRGRIGRGLARGRRPRRGVRGVGRLRVRPRAGRRGRTRVDARLLLADRGRRSRTSTHRSTTSSTPTTTSSTTAAWSPPCGRSPDVSPLPISATAPTPRG